MEKLRKLVSEPWFTSSDYYSELQEMHEKVCSRPKLHEASRLQRQRPASASGHKVTGRATRRGLQRCQIAPDSHSFHNTATALAVGASSYAYDAAMLTDPALPHDWSRAGLLFTERHEL